MPEIAVVTDTACDLPKPTRDKYGIQTVPLVVRFGTDECLDTELTVDEFWRRAHQAPPYPGTSQPSAGMFEEAFAPLVEQGAHVLCLTITSRHSGTFNSAYVASQRFPGQVTVFDTLSLSLGQGYQAIAAAQAAADGHSLEEIVAQLESIRARTRFLIALDTIEYLRRGGRADQVMPILERVVRFLNIKPVLDVVDGHLSLLGASRSRAKAMQRMQEELAKHAPAEMVVVIYTQPSSEAPEFAQTLAEHLDFPLDQIMIAETGPVLSCQGGPGIIAAAVVQRAG
jgi:DegV family protein with EDD domain